VPKPLTLLCALTVVRFSESGTLLYVVFLPNDMKTACQIQFQAIPCTISHSKQVSQSTKNLSAHFWVFGLIEITTFLDHRCFMLFHCVNPFRGQPMSHSFADISANLS